MRRPRRRQTRLRNPNRINYIINELVIEDDADEKLDEILNEIKYDTNLKNIKNARKLLRLYIENTNEYTL